MDIIKAVTHQVVVNGEPVFSGDTDDCYKWMTENKTSGKLVALPVPPLNPITMKELQDLFEAGIYKPGRSS